MQVIVADTAIRILGPDGTIRSEWIPDVEPTEIGLGPMFVVAAPDGSVYVSLQLYDTIRKFHVVESELVEDTVSSTAAPSHAPTLPAGSSPRPIAVETTSFDRFKVPFTLDLPATWHTQDQGLGIVNVGEDRPPTAALPSGCSRRSWRTSSPTHATRPRVPWIRRSGRRWTISSRR